MQDDKRDGARFSTQFFKALSVIEPPFLGFITSGKVPGRDAAFEG